jgi:hypothetical protein
MPLNKKVDKKTRQTIFRLGELAFNSLKNLLQSKPAKPDYSLANLLI